jgi:hypothetical protein
MDYVELTSGSPIKQNDMYLSNYKAQENRLRLFENLPSKLKVEPLYCTFNIITNDL